MASLLKIDSSWISPHLLYYGAIMMPTMTITTSHQNISVGDLITYSTYGENPVVYLVTTVNDTTLQYTLCRKDGVEIPTYSAKKLTKKHKGQRYNNTALGRLEQAKQAKQLNQTKKV